MVAYLCVWLFVFVVPWENVVMVSGVGTLSKLMGIAAFGIIGLRVLLTAKLRKLTTFHLVAFVYLCWILLSTSWAVNTACHPDVGCDVRLIVNTYIQLFVMLWVLWEAAPTRGRLLGLLQAYVLGAYVSAADTIRNYLVGEGFKRAAARFAATGFDPNDLGMMMALGLPIAWYFSSRASGPFQRWLNRVYLVAGPLAILLTGSRGALLATIVALCVIPWTMGQVRLGVRVTAAVLIVVTGIVAVRVVPERLFERLSTTESEISQGTMNDRLQIWKAGLAAVPGRPLQGYGPAGWQAELSRRLDIKGAHNTYLSILVEEGLIGLSLYLGMFFVIIKRLLPLPRFERRVTLTLLATLATAITPLDWDTRKPAWLVIGLLVGCGGVLAQRRVLQPDPAAVSPRIGPVRRRALRGAPPAA